MTRRTVTFAWLCMLLCATHAYAGGASVLVDFDGDGQMDRAVLDAKDPSIVRIWLSATKSTHVIRSRQPLLAVTAADLNGDRRAELIAITRSSRIRVWTKKRAGFRSYRRLRPPVHDVTRPDRHTLDGDDGGAAVAVFTDGPAPPATRTNIHRRGPPPSARFDRRDSIDRHRASLGSAPFSPRPPPLG